MSGDFTPDPSWPTLVELATEVWGQPNQKLSGKDDIRWGHEGGRHVTPSTNTWKIFEPPGGGGGYVDMWKLARGNAPLPPRGGHKTNGAHPPLAQDKATDRVGLKPWEHVGVAYPYRDATGGLILEAVRMKPPWPGRFMQRCPNGERWNGETQWKWSVKHIVGHDCLLYRLPELLASAAQGVTVFVVEGEKDADNLAALGLIATTNIGGAGKWRADYAQYFAGRHVVVLPDNDEAGEAQAHDVATSLHGVATSLRVYRLPGLLPKGDVSDWLADGGTRDELLWQAREAPLWEPPAMPPPTPPDDGGGEVEDEGEGPPEGPPPPEDDPGGPGATPPLPVITCQAGELPRMVNDAQKALLTAKLPIYQRGMLVQPTEQQYTAADGSVTHSAALVPITAPALLKMLAQAAIWQKWDGRVNGGRGGYVTCDPPERVVSIVLHNRGAWPFPVVRGVLTCPTLRPDGSPLVDPGYDETSRYYLIFPQGLTVPAITEAPTVADAQASLMRLDALLDSYPFVSKASRSVALAMLMTQVLRCAMPTSPLLAVSARAPGTGKSHLVDLCSTVAIGRPCPAMGAGKKDEETEKGINTMLISGVPGFSIDNVSRDLDTPTLNMATERPLITIRLFGVLENIEVENAVTIYMTGNNLAIIDEQGRRTIRCELDAGQERPERRHFASDPIHAARADRGQLIADVLTLARAYHTSGTKLNIFPLGSYGAWSHFVREPLVWLGEADPAETMNETARDDPATIRLHAILSGWYFDFQLVPKTLADAVKDASPELRDALKEAFPGRGGAEIDTTRFGYWMRRFAGRVADKMRFVKEEGLQHSAVRWKISLV
jgi:putative DNA primase/helicase